MPKHVTPGVYVEETRHRGKAIEGVATSTTGFIGAARFGPTQGAPVLVTSVVDFQRHFGDAADLLFGGVPTVNHLARAVQLFFANGGGRLYIARIFASDGASMTDCAAKTVLQTSAGAVTIAARFPGVAGNVLVRAQAVRSGNLRGEQAGLATLTGVRAGDLVEVSTALKARLVKPSTAPAGDLGDPLTTEPAELAAVSFDRAGRPMLTSSTGQIDLAAVAVVQKIELIILVEPNRHGSTGSSIDHFTGLSTHPHSKVFVGRVLRTAYVADGIDPPADPGNRIYLRLPQPLPDAPIATAEFAAMLLRALVDGERFPLAGGSDGAMPGPAEFRGAGDGQDASGLAALAGVDDIAVVAAPGSAALPTDDARRTVRDALISHCEVLKYRFAVLAAELTADLAVVRKVRADHGSNYAALYHPWLVVPSPTPDAPSGLVSLSPEGAICGIYARSDDERGVHKAPANALVRGVLRFSTQIAKGAQDVLNPEGINCLRYFEGRGNLVWGARTISGDSEWVHVNVRRLFIYLEHSIDRGTRWAVFEPNNEQLWRRTRQIIEVFLLETWRSGALMGTKPDEAFFVRCDRTTMTQNDLDNGRLVCQIGIAPIKPAEFMIFRVEQWTADASTI